jgi:transposase, IS30 family
MSHYTQLQRDQLCAISALTEAGASATAIAKQLGLSRSTLYREWARCGGRARYELEAAVAQRARARAGGAQNARRYDCAAWAEVNAALQNAWSPDSIAGRRRVLCGADERPLPRRSRIYVWAHAQDAPWWKHKRIRRYGSRGAKPAIGRNGAPEDHWRARLNSIESRADSINQRIEFRHWELDSVVGLQRESARLLVAVERLSLLTRIAFLPRYSALLVAKAVAGWRGKTKRSRAMFASFTPDQGSEFARLETVFPAEQVYLCHKHSPWEKGRVENTNGLIRHYVPKGQSMSDLTAEKVAWIEGQLNNRPRASLGYLTPNEVAFLEQSHCPASCWKPPL